MIGKDPVSAAFDAALLEKKHRNYIRPRRRDRLERKTKRLCRDLIVIWAKMRRFHEDHPKYLKLEKRTRNIIDKVSEKLTALGLFTPDWMIKYKEEFERKF